MNKMIGAAALVALLGACGSPQPATGDAAASNASTAKADDRQTKRQRRASMYLRADADGDGVVTRAEIEKEAADRFARLDKNGDGVFSAAEIAARPGYARSGDRGENRRGPVTREEHMERALGRFDRRDRDDDGRLSGDELARFTRRAAP